MIKQITENFTPSKTWRSRKFFLASVAMVSLQSIVIETVSLPGYNGMFSIRRELSSRHPGYGFLMSVYINKYVKRD